MAIVMVVRITLIVVGVALFAYAEFKDARNERKPYATGTNRTATFVDDATVLGLRLGGVVLVLLSLLTWVIGNHLAVAHS